MILVHFQRKPFNITVIQVYDPTTNAKEAEVDQFYEDLEDLLELTPKKDVLFLTRGWNSKVGSQDIPGVTGKFSLGEQNEGQRLTEFCQENALVTAKTLFQQHKRQLYTSDQIRSVAQSCPTLCDPMNRSTPGLSVHHQLPEFTQTHVHRVSDAIQPSHPLSSPSPPAPNPSQHQSLFQ